MFRARVHSRNDFQQLGGITVIEKSYASVGLWRFRATLNALRPAASPSSPRRLRSKTNFPPCQGRRNKQDTLHNELLPVLRNRLATFRRTQTKVKNNFNAERI